MRKIVIIIALLYLMMTEQVMAQDITTESNFLKTDLLVIEKQEDDVNENTEEAGDESEDKKKVSILGDSLGTYQWYSTWGIYYKYYADEYMESVNNTWWMRYITYNNMELSYNDSLGGSKVSWAEGDAYPVEYCMASEERINNLGKYGTPDIILFFGGINDVISSELGQFDPNQEIGDVSNFSSAYQTAILRMKDKYPNTEIISMTPYYWYENQERVDLYAERIIEICQYYNVEYVDLRKAGVDIEQDVFALDRIHTNKEGHAKIWYMLQHGIPKLSSNGIEIISNCNNYVHAQYNIRGISEGTQFQWQVYDYSNSQWIHATDWEESNALKYTVPHEGVYWVSCTAKNQVEDQITETIAVYCEAHDLEIYGISAVDRDSYIELQMQYACTEENLKFRWQVYNLELKQWFLPDDWSENDTVEWTPDRGVYWLYTEVKDSENEIISFTKEFYVGRKYPGYINGKYQGPNPYGNGWLLGVSSNNNPKQKYQYELLILDCEKYVAGDPHPWIYSSGLCNVYSGSTFWTTFEPEHSGYYWTYFRIYDEFGNLIDDACYDAYCKL